MSNLSTRLNYPLIAVGDLHGQRAALERLVARLERLPEWPACALVFLGDFVDRGEDVPGTIELVLELLGRPAGGSAVMGNHDLALVRAARLDDGPPSPYWIERYRDKYNAESTFTGYLHRSPNKRAGRWERDLDDLRRAMPERHRAFLAGLPWVVEAAGHIFLHCGLSPELEASAAEQVEALHRRAWDRAELRPRAGSDTDRYWVSEYPVWIGADRGLSGCPLPFPGKVQVTGHVQVARPEFDDVRIRLDTSGGAGVLTACLLRAADGAPEFLGHE